MGPADDELRVYLDLSCIETNHIASPKKKLNKNPAAGEEPDLPGRSIESGVDERERTG